MCTKYFNVITLLACLIFMSTAFGQKSHKVAAEHFRNNNYIAALPVYMSLLKTDSLNVEYAVNAAKCMLRTNTDRTRAIPVLEMLVRNNVATGETHFLLAKAYTFEYNFGMSSLILQKNKLLIPEEYNVAVERMLKNNESAKILMQNPVNVSFENLGSKVNSEFPDYYPYVTENESSLIFTSRRKKSGAIKEFDGYYNSDIYQVQKFDSEYPRVKNLGITVNTNLDEQVVGLSRDGIEMMVYIDHVDDYGDIYLSHQASSKYTPIQKLGVNVNSEELETSASFSEDGNTLFFASRREGGYGGLDIYMSRLLPDGTWGKSQNLGPDVNTSGDEDFPFLAQDDQLFFSSDGHPGMGGADLNLTVWNPETNKWGKVLNMGFPINTPGDNRTISFNKNGSHAYVSMYRNDGFGDLDIYRVVFNEEKLKPAFIEFSVRSVNSEDALLPDLIVLDMQDNIYGIYRPSSSGKYMIPLIPGSYNLSIEAEGFNDHYKELVVLRSEVDGKIHPKVVILEKP